MTQAVTTDPAVLAREAANFERISEQLRTVIARVQKAAAELDTHWQGEAATGARNAITRFHDAATPHVDQLNDISAKIHDAGIHYTEADEEAARRLAKQMHMGGGDEQEHDRSKVQQVDNRHDRDARQPDGRGRDPDGRDGRRERSDEAFRRPEGGKGDGTDWFDSDWAGRAILERYLYGGGREWDIEDDPGWSKYMMDNPSLARNLDSYMRDEAQQSLNNYLHGNGAARGFSHQVHEEMQNGESMTGYQYLHGSEQTVGDFQLGGTTHAEALPGGNYKVVIDGQYKWNDVIDPNFQYSTDQFKARIGQILSLGQAKPYDIHIGWQAQSEFVFRPDGSLVSAKGYPYQ